MGVTGSIGAGKSAVARLLAERGAALIDADELARAAAADPAVLERIRAELGAELVRGGRLDRAATGALVFADPEALEKLNGIIHPWVRRRTWERVEELRRQGEPPPVIVLDVPLLFENGLEDRFDAVIAVVAPLAERVRRVAARSGLSEEEVRARDAAQWPQERKAALADFVIENAGSEEELAGRVAEVWARLIG